jgi:hypothetical protein
MIDLILFTAETQRPQRNFFFLLFALVYIPLQLRGSAEN